MKMRKIEMRSDRRTGSAAAALLGTLLLPATAAQAHTPYLLPNVFATQERDHVTLQSSFTEEFFVPDIVMKAEDFHAIGPDGAKTALPGATYFKDVGIIEAALPAPGTYRFSTGLRQGRTSKVAKVDGEWKPAEGRPGTPPPPDGAPSGEQQSFTRSDVYVTRGAISAAALAPTGSGVELRPLTHPNQVGVEKGFAVELLLDGKPLAGQTLALHGSGPAHRDGKPVAEVKTDAKGRATLAFKEPGTYLVMARYRAEAPAAGGTSIRAFTYALTFDVGR
jgi:uncharacterized GH25 family protein